MRSVPQPSTAGRAPVASAALLLLRVRRNAPLQRGDGMLLLALPGGLLLLLATGCGQRWSVSPGNWSRLGKYFEEN